MPLTGPAGSSTTNDGERGSRWFCQFGALPFGHGERPEAHAREAREAAAGGAARPPGAHERLRLVEPERQPRPEPEDQGARGAALRLGQRPRARPLRRPALPDPEPHRREVAVQVDAVGVLPGPVRDAVRVQVRDEPEVDSRNRPPLEQPHDRDPGRLVPVDAADDEHDAGAPAHLDRADRTALRGVPDDLDMRRRRGGEEHWAVGKLSPPRGGVAQLVRAAES